ncbi:response regulator [Aeromonas jandaei]|uniref:Response regulator n=1 Tax=Aeromonas jandaei TaxID=650 RepID=A0ABD7EKR7_AERJA|nr:MULTISPECIES: response regulator [Aeromonas]MBL0545091.1 response regulator [Aeromonas jandaei]MBL0597612.1 response regulator [Aeromonas jandaei]MBL0667279.1 response regulator [Aeromonas jandaei]MBW3804256.1 response regulator [Aeromonas jandaei]MCQ4056187.1 response regulator [Aeromonas sp. SG16]
MLRAGLRILVVEDEAVFRHSLVSYLARDGATVFQAEDGIEGLSAAALYHPDVVLCDLNMPNMDGHEVIACLSARYPDIPVIVISAQSTMEAVAGALRAGARDYLLKPLEDYALVERSIEQCLKSQGTRSQQLELMDHMEYFSAHDRAASRLLAGLKPPGLQEWGPWQITFKGLGQLFIPDTFKVGDKLLVLVMELPIMGTDAAFCGALVRSLMNVPYRQFQRKESQLLSQPHRLLDYLNHQLMESGLRSSFAMAALLFDQEDGLVFANAGLTSPHWLMRSGGLPLGLMRSSHYALHKRSWHEPFDLQFCSDSGSALHVQVRYH